MDTKIKLLFCGDLAPIGKNEKLMIEGTDLFNDIISDIKDADVSFVNLEAPITMNNRKILKNGPCLKSNPKTIESIKKSGLNLIGLANNHIMDYGEEGLNDTLYSCKIANIDTVGAGENLTASQKVYYKKLNNVTIAIIAIAEHEFSIAEEKKAGSAPLDMIENYNQIKEAKENADIVIVTLHGGNEYFQYPRPGLRKVCKHFIDLGVDAVICHHIHTVGAYEVYKDKFISYGLGNFLFDSTDNKVNWDKGYMVKLSIDIQLKTKIEYEIIPYSQQISNPGIKKLENNEKKSFLQELDNINKILQNNELWLKEWDMWCKEKSKSYIVNNYLPFKFRGIGLITRNINLSNILALKNTIPSKLNFIECESHKEVLVNVLNKIMETK